MALGSIPRHALNTVILFTVFAVLVLVAPDVYEKHAEMHCDGLGDPVAVFPDITKCGQAQVGKWQSCGCLRPEAKWTAWYDLGFVPITTAIAALFVLTGSLWARLIVLNLAISLAIIANAVYSVTRDPAYAMVMPLVPLEVLAFCVGITILFMLMDHARVLLLRRRNHAT